MTKTIALAGKGGTGKTTIAALLIRSLLPHSRGPLLAIDADPASNLHLALGLALPTTVGEIREKMSEATQERQLGVAISRHEYLDYEVRMALEEGEKIDLLAMGRPEGQGCYCAANSVMRTVMDRISAGYNYVVMDNEAGLEHLSRRTTRDADVLFIVSDPTQRGIVAAQRVADLVDELEINVKSRYLILNRFPGGADELPSELKQAIDSVKAKFLGVVSYDATLVEFEFTGRPLIELNGDSPVYRSVREMVKQVLP